MHLKPPAKPPLLQHGARMKQPEFHRLYEAHPGPEKFELIGGMVYMASPVTWTHGEPAAELAYLLGVYKHATPGVRLGQDATTILGEESEPQPDLTLRIDSACGGQSRVNDDEYVEGAPELVAEIAYSSVSIDLNEKREDYEQAGVKEYLVVCIEEQELRWFDFTSGNEITANRKGEFRSRIFPGLWIHGEALLALDSDRLVQVLQKGLSSRAHVAFVKRLDRARRKK